MALMMKIMMRRRHIFDVFGVFFKGPCYSV
jgi:hypothetical protein